MNPYPLVDDLARPALRVRMPRAPRLVAPGGSIHVVARCNNREFYFTTATDFDLLLAHLREPVRTYEVTVYAYTLMSNHVHLLTQAPTYEALGRPLRWLMTETARAFHKARGRRGHFWERRYRACLVEADTYALATLRYLDRNPVRSGLVEDPTTYPWPSCAAYALGAPNRVIAFHPSYLALSPHAKVRQRHYRTLLAPSDDPRADARDPRWTTQRTVGSPAFMAPYVRRRGRRRTEAMPRHIKSFSPKWCPVPFYSLCRVGTGQYDQRNHAHRICFQQPALVNCLPAGEVREVRRRDSSTASRRLRCRSPRSLGSAEAHAYVPPRVVDRRG